MKNKTITIENLPDQKMSDIFESVGYDLDKIKKQGVKINMDSFIHVNHACTVCLGGAAVCGFFPVLDKEVLRDLEKNLWPPMFSEIKPEGKINGYTLTDGQIDNLRRMSYMFNAFRMDDIRDTVENFNDFSEREIPEGEMDKVRTEWRATKNSRPNLYSNRDITEIKEVVNQFVTLLRKHGL